jgi:hypothetical protein
MLIHLLRSRQAQTEANTKLQAYTQQQDANMVYRGRLAEVSVQLQRCHSFAELALVGLREARALLGAMQGALYVSDLLVPGRLLLAGAAACAQEPPEILELGEGLLGQCAKERRLQIIANPVDGDWTLRSGLGNARPAALLLAPLVMQDALIGVVELALLRQPDAHEQARVEELVALLANSLEILRRNLQSQQQGSGASASVEATV